MKAELLGLFQEMKRIYVDIMDGDILELYSSNADHLETLFTRIQTFEIDKTSKPLLEELNGLNILLVQRLKIEKDNLVRERQLFEKQKSGVEQYSIPQTQHYQSFFIDKNG